MNVSPAYLWYPNDALSSGRIEELTATEECWYRRALDRSWVDDGIPADPVRLAKRIGKKCTVAAAKKLLEMFFIPHAEDASRMVNPRQEIERRKMLDSRLRKSSGGKKGMASRYGTGTYETPKPKIVITEQLDSNNISSASSISTQEEDSNESFLERGKPANGIESNHVATYFEFYPKSQISLFQQEVITYRISDDDRWRRALTFWKGNEYIAKNVAKICDYYDELEAKENGTDKKGYQSERDKQDERVRSQRAEEERLFAVGIAKREAEARRALSGDSSPDDPPDGGLSEPTALIG